MPSSEQVKQWMDDWHKAKIKHDDIISFVADQAAQWASDEELNACRLWVSENCSIYEASELDVFRRPKPLSPKQQALQFLSENLKPGEELVSMTLPAECIDAIRQALEQLPD